MIYMFLHGNILYSSRYTIYYNIRIIDTSFNVQSQGVDEHYLPQWCSGSMVRHLPWG